MEGFIKKILIILFLIIALTFSFQLETFANPPGPPWGSPPPPGTVAPIPFPGPGDFPGRFNPFPPGEIIEPPENGDNGDCCDPITGLGAYIFQWGDNNYGEITQINKGHFGLIKQYGDENEAFISQRGLNHYSVIYQNGYDNFGNVDQRGNNHFNAILQIGDNNTSNIFQRGTSHIAGILQIGNDNNASISQTGSNETDFKITIEQFGNNLNLDTLFY